MENHFSRNDRFNHELAYKTRLTMENFSLNSALVITLISVAAFLVLFLSMFSGETLHAEVSDSSDIYKDMDDIL